MFKFQENMLKIIKNKYNKKNLIFNKFKKVKFQIQVYIWIIINKIKFKSMKDLFMMKKINFIVKLIKLMINNKQIKILFNKTINKIIFLNSMFIKNIFILNFNLNFN